MTSNVKIFVSLLFLFAVSLSAEAGRKCTPRRLSPNKKYKHLRQHYHLVEKVQAANVGEILKLPRRVRRSAPLGSNNPSSRVIGSTHCPWRWGTDEDPSRFPRFFQLAECPGCVHYCRAVYYVHKALFKRCDSTTGIRVWKWIDLSLPIAFLYDP